MGKMKNQNGLESRAVAPTEKWQTFHLEDKDGGTNEVKTQTLGTVWQVQTEWEKNVVLGREG